MHNYKIIDIHTHTYPPAIAKKACENLAAFYNFEVTSEGTYDDLEKQAKENGVCGFLLFSVATNAHQVPKVNSSIAELAEHSRQNGFETVGFAGMYQDFEDFGGELDRCIGLGLKGVKIHPDIQQVDIDDDRMLRLYEEMVKRGLPLFLHMGDDRPQYRFSEPKKLARVLDRFPELEVVAAHFGGYKSWDGASEYLWGRRNVRYDCSSALWAMDEIEAERLIRGCGVDRVMYGTDYPIPHLNDYFDLFMKISLTEEERRDILYNNAKRFFDSIDAKALK
nr:amidohydrolase [Clostridia bacterium]